MGISDSDWQNLTFLKIKAITKLKNRLDEFEVIMHGGKIEKKPKKAKYLSDLGIYGK